MGLNIGITVQALKYTGDFDGNSNPKAEGLQDRFNAHLREIFPDKSFSPYVEISDEKYIFGVRVERYGRDFNYDTDDMYKAIFAFIIDEFGFTSENLKLEVWYSP